MDEVIHDIAVIPGDGIGNEVVPAAQRVLERGRPPARLRLPLDGLRLGLRALPRDRRDDARRTASTGCARHEAIFLGAVGRAGRARPRVALGPAHPDPADVPSSTSTSARSGCSTRVHSPLAAARRGSTSSSCARTSRASTREVGGRLYAGQEGELAAQLAVFTRRGRERVVRYAFASRGRAQRPARRRRRSPTGSSTRCRSGTRSSTRSPPSTPTSRSSACSSTRCARGSSPARVARRHRRLEPVRRHPQRPRRRRRRQHRHRAGGEPQPRARPPVDVRAGPRLGARHRRAGDRQPGRRRSGPAR